jgi:dTDP-4-dehydrorhamnose 3,5-epimerase
MRQSQPTKAPSTVTVDGHSLKPLIDGLKIRPAVTQQDHRGTLCEIFDPRWQFDDLPLVHVYMVSIRPGLVKGWAVHSNQVDRYFFARGTLKLVLYDSRSDSPTHGMVNELYFSDFNRSLVSVPEHVYHAIENVGTDEGFIISVPSEPYQHGDPDKWLLPLDNDLIPYSFRPGLKGF